MNRDIRAKALAALRDGRVAIYKAHTELDEYGQPGRPAEVQAAVASSRSDRRYPYAVDLLDETWTCTCHAFIRTQRPCPHIAAVQIVTGHDSAARRRPTHRTEASR